MDFPCLWTLRLDIIRTGQSDKCQGEVGQQVLGVWKEMWCVSGSGRWEKVGELHGRGALDRGCGGQVDSGVLGWRGGEGERALQVEGAARAKARRRRSMGCTEATVWGRERHLRRWLWPNQHGELGRVLGSQQGSI